MISHYQNLQLTKNKSNYCSAIIISIHTLNLLNLITLFLSIPSMIRYIFHYTAKSDKIQVTDTYKGINLKY